MTRRLLAIAALFGVLAVACGKVGPPVRLRAEPAVRVDAEPTVREDAEPTAAGSSEANGKPAASPATTSTSGTVIFWVIEKWARMLSKPRFFATAFGSSRGEAVDSDCSFGLSRSRPS